jgi:1-acyl-sn-glycerol-3-phosphate acyltransferase
MVAVECNALRIALRSKISEAAGASHGIAEGVDTNPRTLATAVEMFAPLARYHRLKVSGFDNIPRGPALFVANHSGGLHPVDALFLFRYYEQFGYDDPIFVLAHDLLFELPQVSNLLNSIGAIRASKGRGQQLLREGHKLLVFPGGDLDNMRAFSRRREVVFGGRSGFVRLARGAGVPIIPVVSAGAHETFVVLTQGRRLAKFMGLPKRLRVNSCPVVLAAPWGVLWGPGMLLPYLPLPSKVSVQVGTSIDLSRAPLSSLGDGAAAEHVRAAMQDQLEEMYDERRYPVLG